MVRVARNALFTVFVKPDMKLFLFLMLLPLAACSKKEAMPRCNPALTQHRLQTGKTLHIDTFTIDVADTTHETYTYQVNDGANLVFTYTHAYEECREIADDEQIDKIIFEVPAAAAAFVWEDSAAFGQAKLYYHQVGAWGGTPMLVKAGRLEGRKVTSSRWRITAALQTPGIKRTLNIDNDFTP